MFKHNMPLTNIPVITEGSSYNPTSELKHLTALYITETFKINNFVAKLKAPYVNQHPCNPLKTHDYWLNTIKQM